jgi:hypothetical protein
VVFALRLPHAAIGCDSVARGSARPRSVPVSVTLGLGEVRFRWGPYVFGTKVRFANLKIGAWRRRRRGMILKEAYMTKIILAAAAAVALLTTTPLVVKHPAQEHFVGAPAEGARRA